MKKPSSRKGSPAPQLATPPDEVLGDLIDSDFDVRVEDDGKVQIHAKCTDGDSNAAAERVRFLIEALGADFMPPPDLPR